MVFRVPSGSERSEDPGGTGDYQGDVPLDRVAHRAGRAREIRGALWQGQSPERTGVPNGRAGALRVGMPERQVLRT